MKWLIVLLLVVSCNVKAQNYATDKYGTMVYPQEMLRRLEVLNERMDYLIPTRTIINIEHKSRCIDGKLFDHSHEDIWTSEKYCIVIKEITTTKEVISKDSNEQ